MAVEDPLNVETDMGRAWTTVRASLSWNTSDSSVRLKYGIVRLSWSPTMPEGTLTLIALEGTDTDDGGAVVE